MVWEIGTGKTNIIPQNYGIQPITELNYVDTLQGPLTTPLLFVNNQGARFTNEQVFNEATAGVNMMRNLPGEDLYSIFDVQLLEILKEKGSVGLMDIDSAYIDTPRTFVEVGWETNSEERYEEANTPVDLTDHLQELVDAGYIVKADTIEELAELLQMPKLAANVERYNTLCEQGQDVDCRRMCGVAGKIKRTQ